MLARFNTEGAHNMNLAIAIMSLMGAIGPQVLTATETLFSKKPKSGPQKAQAALAMAQAALTAALGIDPKAFGPAEITLVKGINDQIVAYYNTKGWPTP
jgi:hypothetical protein